MLDYVHTRSVQVMTIRALENTPAEGEPWTPTVLKRAGRLRRGTA
jgi:hypothetical protein